MNDETKTPASTKLWMAEGGRIACTTHSGAYLTAAACARPHARTHHPRAARSPV